MRQILFWLLFLRTTTATALSKPVAQIRRLLRHLPERASWALILLFTIVFLFVVEQGSLLVSCLVESVLLLIEVLSLTFTIDLKQFFLLLTTDLLQPLKLCLLFLLLVLRHNKFVIFIPLRLREQTFYIIVIHLFY